MEQPPVLVVGAGPAGLATLACLRQQGVAARLVDRQGLVGGAYRRLYPRTILSSPARWTSLPGLQVTSSGEYLSVAEYSQYLQSYAAHHQIQADQAEVEGIRRHDGRFLVRFGDGSFESYRVVVAATGLDTPVWPAIPGLSPGPCCLHSQDWQGPQPFQGKSLLILGRGSSAVEIAEECARAGLRPVVSARGGRVVTSAQRFLGRDLHDYAFRFSWLPRWLAGAYCRTSPTFPGTDLGFSQLRQAGQIQVRPEVTGFEQQKAIFADGERAEFEAMVVATGYHWGMPYLPEAVARSRGGFPLGRQGQSPSWSGLYLMGVHCGRGVSSQFLRGMALDAPALARRIRRRLQ